MQKLQRVPKKPTAFKVTGQVFQKTRSQSGVEQLECVGWLLGDKDGDSDVEMVYEIEPGRTHHSKIFIPKMIKQEKL